MSTLCTLSLYAFESHVHPEGRGMAGQGHKIKDLWGTKPNKQHQKCASTGAADDELVLLNIRLEHAKVR